MKKTENDKPRIKITRNGPYVITGNIPLVSKSIVTDEEGYSYKWQEEKQFKPQKQYLLCRCGNSKNKPFCDGSHIREAFDGTETALREPYLKQAGVIEGPELNLTDAEELCASARFCDRAGGIWNLTLQSDHEAAKKIAIDEAHNCPSGRLVIWNKEGQELEVKLKPSIVLVEDPQQNCHGPIWVRGGIPVESADGEVYEIRNRITLCRCGMSTNKPFCDSSHIPIDG